MPTKSPLGSERIMAFVGTQDAVKDKNDKAAQTTASLR
jgi:hypothetical protein